MQQVIIAQPDEIDKGLWPLVSDLATVMTVAPEALDVIFAQYYNREYGAQLLTSTLAEIMRSRYPSN